MDRYRGFATLPIPSTYFVLAVGGGQQCACEFPSGCSSRVSDLRSISGMPLGSDLGACTTGLLGYSHFTIDMPMKSTANGSNNIKPMSEPSHTNSVRCVISIRTSPVRPNHINNDSPAYVSTKDEEVYFPNQGSNPKRSMLCPDLQETSRSEASGTVRPCMLAKSNGKILQNRLDAM
jgi:hypothetical protein